MTTAPIFRLIALTLGLAFLCPLARGQFASPHEKKLGQPAPPTHAARLMENLDRGVVAVNNGSGAVFVSWRLLGTEAPDTGFNLYRATGAADPVKLNTSPLLQGTYFHDAGVDLTQPVAYTVRAVVGGGEQAASKPFTIPAHAPPRPYLAIPLHALEGYNATDCSCML